MSEILTAPGLVEIHNHLRGPGTNKSEDIASGTYAAQQGGYVAVWDMPNNPGRKTLTVGRYKEKVSIADDEAYTTVGFHAGFDPQESHPDEFRELMGVTDSVKWYMGDTTGNSRKYGANDYRTSAQITKEENPQAVIFLHAHPETLDETLYMTTQEFGLSTHVCHVKAENLYVIEKYRRLGGARLTTEVTPHHILMDEHERVRRGWLVGMMPPLESVYDIERLLWGLNTGEIDAVATDHAPHPKENKLKAEVNNPMGETGEDCDTCYGIPSSEFAFPLMRNLVRKGLLSEERLIDAFTVAPARIMGVTHHSDTTVQFTDEVFEIEETDIKSACGHSPYVGSYAVGRLVSLKIKGQEYVQGHDTPQPVKAIGPLRRGAII
jgi:dihydroorotase